MKKKRKIKENERKQPNDLKYRFTERTILLTNYLNERTVLLTDGLVRKGTK